MCVDMSSVDENWHTSKDSDIATTGFHLDLRISEWISAFQNGFLDFKWISGFRSGFLDFKVHFWISKWISGFRSGFLDFKRISGFHFH